MKEKFGKAIVTAVIISLGITVATCLKGDSFSIAKAGLYAVVAFAVDFLFSLLFDKKKKES